MWKRNNPQYSSIYTMKRYYIDDVFRTTMLIRSRIRTALSSRKIPKINKYKIDYQGIIERLGPKPDGDYHVDHIKPLSSFDLSDEQQFKKAFSPKNHQWLTAEDNLKKGSKIL